MRSYTFQCLLFHVAKILMCMQDSAEEENDAAEHSYETCNGTLGLYFLVKSHFERFDLCSSSRNLL